MHQLRRHPSVVLLAAGMASAGLVAIRRKVQESFPGILVIDDPGGSAQDARDGLEQTLVRAQESIERDCSMPVFELTNTDSIIAPFSTFGFDEGVVRSSRYTPHVGYKQQRKELARRRAALSKHVSR